jgi:hypothetical protein
MNDNSLNNTIASPRVLCFVPYGSWNVHNQLDCIIGTALKIRGAEVQLLTCDGLFQDQCYVLAHSKNPEQDCLNCSLSGKSFFSQFPLPLDQLRNYVKIEDLHEIERWLIDSNIPECSSAVYKGLPVGEWVRTSVRSFYVVNPRNLILPEVQDLFRKYIKYAWVTYCAAQRFFEHFKPTQVIMFGGYGFLHAPVFELARSLNINVITHERGQLPSRFSLASNSLVDYMESLEPILDAWESIPFNESEFEQVKSIFVDWEQGRNRAAGVFIKKGSQDTLARSKLGIPEGAPIIAAFTSGEHELATEELRQQGGKQLELVKYLIDIFRDRPEYLVIRHHPNLGAGIRSRLDYNYLTRAYKLIEDLPPNVRVIFPNEEQTSYSVLWNAVATIPFMSTLAIESVARGLPTAVMELSSFKRVATHVISDFTRTGMEKIVIDLLEHAQNSLDDSRVRKAYRFSRAHNLRYSTLFKSFGIKNSHDYDIRIKSVEDIMPGVDQALDRVCEHIFNNTSLYDIPKKDDFLRDLNIDNKLFHDEISSIIEKRNFVKNNLEKIEEFSSLVLMVTDQDSKDFINQAGLTKQRNANLHYKHIKRTNNIIERLIHNINHFHGDYVLITNPKFKYDECFFNHADSVIRPSVDKFGILHGGWLQNLEEIYFYLFTDHNPTDSILDVQKHFKVPLEIDDILGFCLLKKTAAVEILLKIKQITSGTGNQVAELFNTIKSQNFIKHPFPKLRVMPN